MTYCINFNGQCQFAHYTFSRDGVIGKVILVTVLLDIHYYQNRCRTGWLWENTVTVGSQWGNLGGQHYEVGRNAHCHTSVTVLPY